MADRCGGCPLIALPYAAQLEAKADKVARALAPAIDRGRLEIHPSLNPVSYRMRIRLRITDGRLQFFNPEKSEHCLVLSEALRAAVTAAIEISEKHPTALTHFAEGSVDYAEVRAGSPHASPSIFMGSVARAKAAFEPIPEGLESTSEAMAEPDHSLQTAPTFNDFILGHDRMPLGTRPTQRYALGPDVDFDVPLGAFIQVNESVHRDLIATVRAMVQRRWADDGRHRALRIVDLFGGSGNFTLPLLRDGASVTLIESHPGAVIAAKRSAARQGLSGRGAAFICADLHAPLTALSPFGGAAKALTDIVIANPPRAGLRDAAETIRTLLPAEIILISCNPATLRRDLQRLESAYQVEEAHLFDMFPQTAHAEVLIRLTRRLAQPGALH